MVSTSKNLTHISSISKQTSERVTLHKNWIRTFTKYTLLHSSEPLDVYFLTPMIALVVATKTTTRAMSCNRNAMMVTSEEFHSHNGRSKEIPMCQSASRMRMYAAHNTPARKGILQQQQRHMAAGALPRRYWSALVNIFIGSVGSAEEARARDGQTKN